MIDEAQSLIEAQSSTNKFTQELIDEMKAVYGGEGGAFPTALVKVYNGTGFEDFLQTGDQKGQVITTSPSALELDGDQDLLILALSNQGLGSLFLQ